MPMARGRPHARPKSAERADSFMGSRKKYVICERCGYLRRLGQFCEECLARELEKVAGDTPA